MKTFFDANIAVYANDLRDPRKQQIAVEKLSDAIDNDSGVTSTQVLSEYVSVAVTKLAQDPDVIFRQLLLLEALEIIQVNSALVRRALEFHRTYKINFWDAQIIAAAEVARCEVLLSEDLNPGQLYAGVRVENPFV